jgi:hypothetical protein
MNARDLECLKVIENKHLGVLPLSPSDLVKIAINEYARLLQTDDEKKPAEKQNE